MDKQHEEHARNKEKRNFFLRLAQRENCPYSELFWSAFSRIRTVSIFSPIAGKYGPEYGHFLRSVSLIIL